MVGILFLMVMISSVLSGKREKKCEMLNTLYPFGGYFNTSELVKHFIILKESQTNTSTGQTKQE